MADGIAGYLYLFNVSIIHFAIRLYFAFGNIQQEMPLEYLSYTFTEKIAFLCLLCYVAKNTTLVLNKH